MMGAKMKQQSTSSFPSVESLHTGKVPCFRLLAMSLVSFVSFWDLSFRALGVKVCTFDEAVWTFLFTTFNIVGADSTVKSSSESSISAYFVFFFANKLFKELLPPVIYRKIAFTSY